jgi:pimeloyl-ACP methyl ester carboxylesterase
VSPVLAGHSYGGLFVQLLLDQGPGVAGVALSPALATRRPGTAS